MGRRGSLDVAGFAKHITMFPADLVACVVVEALGLIVVLAAYL